MKIIVGAGALGRVMYDFVSKENEIECFLDDSPEYSKRIVCGKRVFTPQKENLKLIKSKEIFLAIFAPKAKENVVHRIKNLGFIISSYKADNCFISPSAKIGQSNNILNNCMIMNSCRIDNYVHVHFNSVVGHDVLIGAYTTLGPGVTIGGYCEIGKYVTIGMGVMIVPGIKIGEGSVIGAGSVVTKNIEPETVVVGNPAIKIKKSYNQ